jgi:hypothetical protein
MNEIEGYTAHGPDAVFGIMGQGVVATVRRHKNIMWKFQLTVESHDRPDASFKKCYKTLDEAKRAAKIFAAAVREARDGTAIPLPELDAFFK